ncbi:hypothetical protein F5Y15DRAFT_384241 [Xylariaceae sp. FL0016]|nr:hypothetical protein F5Y15DRAFT_384241 [Xylariaceae sp. FL0016]
MSSVQTSRPFDRPGFETPSRVSSDLTECSRDSFATPYEQDPLDVVPDMDEEQCLIEEATVLDTREMKTKEVTIEPPTVPQRSALRASKLLASLKLNSIETATQSLNNKHDVYLSSEEDASSTADESDYDSESSSEESEKSPSRRRSHEDTARAVSVIYVGKPFLIELTAGRRSASPQRRPQSSVFERSSASSLSSNSFNDRPMHPPRQSSLASSVDSRTESPSFLQQDPFANKNYQLDGSSSSDPYGRAPRMPTGAFHRFSKSINLARKRSRPNLKAAAAAARDSTIPASASTSNLLALNTSTIPEREVVRSETFSATTMSPQSPVTYNEILRLAKKNSMSTLSPASTPLPPSQLQSPTSMSPSTSPAAAKRGILSGLNMNRRRSSRIKP